MCKSSSYSSPADAAAGADVLSRWFHPEAVGAIAGWSSANAAQLLEQDVPPISEQELRL
jgi:hypothetical protein